MQVPQRARWRCLHPQAHTGSRANYGHRCNHPGQYRKHSEKDAALERRFQPVRLRPSQELAVQILRGVRDKYGAHHHVTITDEGQSRLP